MHFFKFIEVNIFIIYNVPITSFPMIIGYWCIYNFFRIFFINRDWLRVIHFNYL